LATHGRLAQRLARHVGKTIRRRSRWPPWDQQFGGYA
jgi:hypothetical protein